MIKFTTILKEYSDKIINTIIEKWKSENPNLDDNVAKQLIKLFDQKKGSLPGKIDLLILPDELKNNNKYLDITQYSYSDMVRLLNSIPENPEQIKKAAIEKFVKNGNITKELASSYTARFMRNRELLKQGITNGIEDENGNELFSKEQVIELIPKPLLKNNLYYDPNNWKWDSFEQMLDYLFPSKKQSTGEENTASTDADKIYDKDGIEIYKGDDVHKCISYNPFEPGTKIKKYSWCVTQPGNSNYDAYRFREEQPTFYFVFDRSKPSTGTRARFDDKWHAFVIQVLINEEGYIITSADNYGDKRVKTWEEISTIVPEDTWNKIKGLKNYFKPIALSPVEKGRKLTSGMNLNVDEFKELPQDEKIQYVQGKGSANKLTDDILNILPKYKINFGGVTKTLANVAIDSGQKFKFSQLKDNEKLAQRYAIFRFRHTDYGKDPIPLPFVKYLDEPAQEKYLDIFNDYLTYEYIEKYFKPEVVEKYVNDQLEKLEYLPLTAVKYIKDPKKRQLFETYSKLFSTWIPDDETNTISDEQLENIRTMPIQGIKPSPITEKEWKGMSNDDRSNILKISSQIDNKEQYLTLLYALPYVIKDKSNMYVLVPKTSDLSGNWVLMNKQGNVVKDNISSRSLLDETELSEQSGYIGINANAKNFKRIFDISELEIANNVSEEFKRMQRLAGVKEMKIHNPAEKKIYGIERNGSPYEFGPYTYSEAKSRCEEYAEENDYRATFQPRLYNDMRDSLPSIERMYTPRIDKDGNFEDMDTTPFSQGDLADY